MVAHDNYQALHLNSSEPDLGQSELIDRRDLDLVLQAERAGHPWKLLVRSKRAYLMTLKGLLSSVDGQNRSAIIHGRGPQNEYC